MFGRALNLAQGTTNAGCSSVALTTSTPFFHRTVNTLPIYVLIGYHDSTKWVMTTIKDEVVRFLSLLFKVTAADAFFSPWKIDDSIICSTQQ